MDIHYVNTALGLGAFVNFTNCRVSYPALRVNVTSVWIDPYPFPLRQLKDIKITAETNHNITERDLVVNTSVCHWFLIRRTLNSPSVPILL
uniref:Uncharacterized protein n=1 Tax=Brassica oleracea TaxID=3712 RepID=A0A3P6G789_BRAOL|nr:unnamed protein product [Brassica oleracea]